MDKRKQSRDDGLAVWLIRLSVPINFLTNNFNGERFCCPLTLSNCTRPCEVLTRIILFRNIFESYLGKTKTSYNNTHFKFALIVIVMTVSKCQPGLTGVVHSTGRGLGCFKLKRAEADSSIKNIPINFLKFEIIFTIPSCTFRVENRYKKDDSGHSNLSSHPYPSDSFFDGFRHFHVRHQVLVSSFSRFGILTNHKRRRACDFTCSIFTEGKVRYQVFGVLSPSETCFPPHGQSTAKIAKIFLKYTLYS